MKSTKSFVLAFALSVATLMGGLSTAAASGPTENARPPECRTGVVCKTNTAVRLLNRSGEGGSNAVTLPEGTRVLVRRRLNGNVFVNSRMGRGWTPSATITCTAPGEAPARK